MTLCEDQFNENTLPVCPEVVELQVCLAACVNNKEWPSQVVRLKYETLVKKMNSYPDCIPASKGMRSIYRPVLLIAIIAGNNNVFALKPSHLPLK